MQRFTSSSYRRSVAVLFVALLSLLLVSCATVPITGRSQLNLIPNNEMMAMSFQEYDAFLNESNLSENRRQTQMVKTVGRRIQGAVEQYFADQGMTQELEGYAWEFNLVDSEEVNAWCMPGGKVVVYTGLLPVAQDEAGLAVVMGHEIAHAIARHGNERMSQQLLAQIGFMALDQALKNKPEETRELWLLAAGIGAQVGVMLPYSRSHESEADHLGLIFMAMAGYDPEASVGFWERMAAEGGAKPPEFLSTHPADATRIRKLQEAMPEALQYYRPTASDDEPAPQELPRKKPARRRPKLL